MLNLPERADRASRDELGERLWCAYQNALRALYWDMCLPPRPLWHHFIMDYPRPDLPTEDESD